MANEEVKTSNEDARQAMAYLFSYPFWIYVSPELPTDEIMYFKQENLKIYIYPPFRSGDANTLPIPTIKMENIPFANWVNPDGTPHTDKIVVGIPIMELDPETGNKQGIIIDKPDHYCLPSIKPMDSIRFDIYGNVPSGVEAQINNKLIEIIRFRSKQWWIGQSLRGIIGFNSGIGFHIDINGNPISCPINRIDVSGEFIGDELPIDSNIWNTITDDLMNGSQPPISEILMLDAKHHFASRDFRRFVLDAATACEYVKDETFKRLWGTKSSTEFNRDVVLGSWDMSKHLDVKLKNHFGISYKEEHPSHWKEIQNLWDARGNVSHGSLCAYGKPQIIIDRDKAKDILHSALHCISWLKSLSL